MKFLLCVACAAFSANAFAASDIPEWARIDFNLLPGFSTSIQKDLPDSVDISHQLNSKEKISQNLSTKPDSAHMFSEGTGTRGGGSGITQYNSQGQLESIILLDLYRSDTLNQHPLFFVTDNFFLSSSTPTEEATEIFFQEALRRLDHVYPVLTKKIRAIAQDIPFSHWIASVSAFPLIDDYIEYTKFKNGERQEQIAYRRNNQILYNRDLYQKMDALNRAALRLHEYIYALSSKTISVSIQRFVSLAFSRQILSMQNNEDAQKLLFSFNLSGLDMEKPLLPEGVDVVSSPRGADEICGVMEQVSSDARKNELQILLSYPGGKRKSLTLHGLERSDAVVLFSLSYAKSYLGAKYPSYHYPAQQPGPDIICTRENKISSFEISVQYDPAQSQLELKSAEIEANIFRAQQEFIDLYRQEKALPPAEARALFAKVKTARDHFFDTKLASLNDSSEYILAHILDQIASKTRGIDLEKLRVRLPSDHSPAADRNSSALQNQIAIP